MKLIKKSIIQNNVAIQRKQQIDEGLSLAKRVDSLREAKATEEHNLSIFREQSINLVKDEIAGFIKIKSDLEQEVKELIEKKKIIKEPTARELEIGKWRKETLDKVEQDLVSKSNAITERHLVVTEDIKELELDRVKLEKNKSQIDKNLKDSIDKLNQSNLLLEEAKEEKKKSDKYILSKNKEVKTKEELVQIRERQVDIRTESLAIKEKELNDRERYINDKYETLLRAETKYK